jgi:hypothetical protein
MLKLQQIDFGQIPNKGEKVVEKQLEFGKEGGYLAAQLHTKSFISE